jgi:hypothetical protein
MSDEVLAFLLTLLFFALIAACVIFPPMLQRVLQGRRVRPNTGRGRLMRSFNEVSTSIADEPAAK